MQMLGLLGQSSFLTCDGHFPRMSQGNIQKEETVAEYLSFLSVSGHDINVIAVPYLQ